MTQISCEDVLHLAQLSSLKLTDTETDSLRVDISNILGYVEQLKELDTSSVEPTYQLTGLSNVWRQDEVIDYSPNSITYDVGNGVSRDDLLKLSAETAENSVKVPKVL